MSPHRGVARTTLSSHATFAMWAWLDRIGIILFDASLSAAVFFTLIVLAMMACRQPARRILLARVAILSSLAILPLVGLVPIPRLNLIDTFVESRFFPRAVFQSPTPPERSAEEADELMPSVAADDGAGRVVPRWLSDRSSPLWYCLPRGLALIDLAGVAAASAWLLLGVVGVYWLIGRSRPPSSSTRVLFDQLVAGRSRAVGRVALRVNSRLPHPVVTGLFRPTILIPEALDLFDGDPEPLRLSLLHEIAHAERSDHWFSTIASVAQTIWFFLPQVWWIRSRLRIDQEFLADRSAADRYGTSSEYASSLLSLAALQGPETGGTTGRPGGDAPPPGTIGVQSPLFQRMLMLLHCPYPVESRTPRLWSWTSRVAVMGASIAAACLVIRWPQSSFALQADPTTPGTAGSRFQVSRFVAEPLHEATANRRSMVYVMPLTLPPTFDLEVDVRCTPSELPHIRLAGQPLGVAHALPVPSRTDPAMDDPHRTWWHVHLHRDHRQISLVVEGRSVPASVHTDASSNWLTIEPPSEASVEFRNLLVTW